MPESLPKRTKALPGKHEQHRAVIHLRVARSALQECRRTVPCPSARGSQPTDTNTRPVTCALHRSTPTNTIPHKKCTTNHRLLIWCVIKRWNATAASDARRDFPRFDPILTGSNRTREQNNNKCAWDARCIKCTWVASQLNTIYQENTVFYTNVSYRDEISSNTAEAGQRAILKLLKFELHCRTQTGVANWSIDQKFC